MKKGWGTWTLDYSKKSALDDSVGFWRVSSVKGNPKLSQVTYGVNFKIDAGGFPAFLVDIIRNMMLKDGVTKATQWVKKYSERRAKGS